jgi:hypothetical protein
VRYGRGEADLGAQSPKRTRNYVTTPIAIPGPCRVRVPGEPNSRPAVFVDTLHERLIVPTCNGRAAVAVPAEHVPARHTMARRLTLDSFRACATPRMPPFAERRENKRSTIHEIRPTRRESWKRINMHIDTSADLSLN